MANEINQIKIGTQSYTIAPSGGPYVKTSGDTMTGDLYMANNGIYDCAYIGGSGDSDTVLFESNIGLGNYGFYQELDQIGGTSSNLVQGDGHFRNITTDIEQTDAAKGKPELPTAAAVELEITRRVNMEQKRCVTYAALKNLRDNENLEAGQWYRITDFVTTVGSAYSGTVQSAGHAFDILVFATSSSTLSETAFATQRSGDTYFSNCKLDAWELKYCLDNDITRFAWANTSVGKGIIYYMKDEFGNSASYDFKNIQYKVSFVDSAKCTALNAYNASGCSSSATGNINLLLTSRNTYYYTFSSTSGADLSLSGAAYDNTIKENISNKKIYLSFIVMKAPSIYRMSFEHGCQYISIECSSSIYVSMFKQNVSEVYISCKNFYRNIFENGTCYIVAFCSQDSCYSNYYGINSQYIISVLGYACRSIIFDGWVRYVCLYGQIAVGNYFKTEVNHFAWIAHATFSDNLSTSPTVTNVLAMPCGDAGGYFLDNHIYISSNYVYIGIPFFFSCNFTGRVEYLALNKQSSATYSFSTPTHYLEIAGGVYGSSTNGTCKILTPLNNSPSTVLIRKSNAKTVNV